MTSCFILFHFNEFKSFLYSRFHQSFFLRWQLHSNHMWDVCICMSEFRLKQIRKNI